MKLNKDPPFDNPVVAFVGVGEPQGPVDGTGVWNFSQEGRCYAGGGGDAGGGGVPSAPVMPAEDDEMTEDLTKIKGSRLEDDDSCVVCLSGTFWETLDEGEAGLRVVVVTRAGKKRWSTFMGLG